MLVLKLRGGLGNQLFQYAAARSLSLTLNIPFVMDVSAYHAHDPKETPRDFSLQHFSIANEAVLGTEDVRISQKILSFTNKAIKKVCGEHAYFRIQWLRNRYLDGYWQNEEYFKAHESQIRKEFTLKHSLGSTAETVRTLITAQNNPVSLHIRRGDYVSNQIFNSFHGVWSLEYYKTAMNMIASKIKNPHFFVFSDDIAWAKENLPRNYPIDFVSGKDLKDYEEMFLMSQCKHHIIANSTFSWWGAWLNPYKEKIVIAPKKWFQGNATLQKGIVPSSWIQI